MMNGDQVPLARQVDLALEQLEGELKGMTAGTIVLQIRDDAVGKFGIRHLPIDCGNAEPNGSGLTAQQVQMLRRMAVDSLRRKRNWTHGEIAYDFVLRHGQVYVSVQFESNYNMANLLFRFAPKRKGRRDVAGE
jgi:hypothetical protein